jgi:hypothetical protein
MPESPPLLLPYEFDTVLEASDESGVPPEEQPSGGETTPTDEQTVEQP